LAAVQLASFLRYDSRVADTAVVAAVSDLDAGSERVRHSALVRWTHWITAVSFLALLLSGVEILISHPRFYWGEAGNSATPALFQIPIPASRAGVKTGYGYVLPDQNGWSRYLHFQAAWAGVLAGLLYGIYGFVSGHFRRNLVPRGSDLTPGSIAKAFAERVRWKGLRSSDASTYNVMQRIAYTSVVFVFFPLIVWTGLAMSPAIASAFPSVVTVFGGQQSARTIHFFVTLALVAFFLVHVVMVALSGFKDRMRAMITGRFAEKEPV